MALEMLEKADEVYKPLLRDGIIRELCENRDSNALIELTERNIVNDKDIIAGCSMTNWGNFLFNLISKQEIMSKRFS